MGPRIRTRPVTASAAKVGSRHRPGLAFAALATALGAWAGAVGLASGFLDLGPDVEDRLPLGSPVLAGVALTAVVAVPFSVLSGLAWQADQRSALGASVAGVLLMVWILVELAVIRSISILQPIYFGAGIGFLLVGRHGRTGRPHRAPA